MKPSSMKGRFRLVCGCLALSSLVLLFVPLVDFNGTSQQRTGGMILGVLFWAGLLAGWILYGGLYRKLKRSGVLPEKHRPGMIRFFRNRIAAGADVLGLMALALNVVFLLGGPAPWPWLEALAACAFLLCFHGHYLFNGVTYQQIFSDERRSL